MKRNEMKKVNWGKLYNQFKDKKFDIFELEKNIEMLMLDDDVTCKHGIYSYILTKDEKYLSLRTFSPQIKRETYERQKGVCPFCDKQNKYDISEMQSDHIKPWHKGGRTIAENCQMLCTNHNLKKSGK